MKHKIKKHIKTQGDFDIFETEEGKIGSAHKDEKLKPGDVVNGLKEVTAWSNTVACFQLICLSVRNYLATMRTGYKWEYKYKDEKAKEKDKE